MRDEPIFQTTGQALAVSFLIMSVEARQKNAFRLVLMRIIESVEQPTAKLRAWYKELQGEAGTVNFAGLDPYEVRGQCAMVTRAVADHLPAPERDAVWARYGQQKEKGDGVQGLSQYFAPQLTITDDIAIRALVYGYFDSSKRKPFDPKKNVGGLSYQEISEQRDIHIKTLHRANAIISRTSNILLGMAEARLTPMFQRDGLVSFERESSYWVA
ncbi:MAG TPA: hypothetical protein VIM12_05825 [Noviherbaspirillum sp.]|jgi:hypothetical protein|uniref:hypothetical protein n=1 Tax=Noviherbaspirillum sp. TaxID=1926288 RepID=UPI002F95B4A4